MLSPDTPLYDRLLPLTDHGSAHLTVAANGDAWLALNGKATRLRGDDLAVVVALVTEGMTAKWRAKVGREEIEID